MQNVCLLVLILLCNCSQICEVCKHSEILKRIMIVEGFPGFKDEAKIKGRVVFGFKTSLGEMFYFGL